MFFVFNLSETQQSTEVTTFGSSRSSNAVSQTQNNLTLIQLVYHIYQPYCFTGTTWTSELLWFLKNDCNFEIAAKMPLFVRASFLE
jgi:hypothetical protein